MTLKVKREKCDTCIFWPGNRMFLQRGRVRDMMESTADDGYIICHETLDPEAPEPDEDTGTRPMLPTEAICRGYLDTGRYPQIVQIAERLDLLEEV
jgi:hypothetical protein